MQYKNNQFKSIKKGSFFADSNLEAKLLKKGIEKQCTSSNKIQVKGYHSLFLPVSWNKPR